MHGFGFFLDEQKQFLKKNQTKFCKIMTLMHRSGLFQVFSSWQNQTNSGLSLRVVQEEFLSVEQKRL